MMASLMTPRTAPAEPSPEYLAQSQSESLKRIVWIAAGLPVVFVSLRSYTRIWLRRVFGLDDYLMVVALFLLVAYAAVLTLAANKGLGRHVEYVAQNPQNVMDVALLSFVSQPLVIMSCGLGKTSFALTLIRVSAQRWVIVLLWFMIISMNTFHILISIFVFARCRDPRHLWNPTIPSVCWPPHVFDNLSLFVGSYSAATDFVLALLPWAILWKLQMKRREKFGVALAMSLGIFAVSIAIVKIQYLVANSDDKDITYSLAYLLWWAAVENGVILLGACIPTLRPLLKKVFPGSTARKIPSDNSHQLITFSNFNVFSPKAKRGHWSTTVETQVEHDAQTIDDQSERSMLQTLPNKDENIEVRRKPSSRIEQDERNNIQPHHIKKTTEVDVIYDDTRHSAS